MIVAGQKTNSDSLIKRLQSSLRRWRETDRLMGEELAHLVNLRNEITYLTPSMSEAALGPSTSATSSLAKALGEVEAKKTSLKALTQALAAELVIMTDLMTESSDRELPVADTVVADLREQLQQQTLLNLNVVEGTLLSLNSWEALDQDHVMVLLACFKYHPYLASDTIQAILELDYGYS
jgi:hypothetical protein